MVEWFFGIMIDYGFGELAARVFSNILTAGIAVGLAFLAKYTLYKLFLGPFSKAAKKAAPQMSSFAFREKNLKRFSHVASAVVLTAFSSSFTDFAAVATRLASSYLVTAIFLIIDSAVDTFSEYYHRLKAAEGKPIKGFIQVTRFFIALVGVILIVSILIDKSPLYILSGLGVLSAVLLVIFRDPLLGLTASIVISTNDMVNVGDWVEIPKYDADGSVVDISLTTVRVQNWDMTVTSIPSYALISDSFKNWRGMQRSGGRRIKRSVYIDITSVKFCDEQMISEFRKIQYISNYIDRKIEEITKYNKENKVDTSSLVNGRHLTNLGTFRAYLSAYIRNHPRLNKEMIMMVRQLPPGEFGIPIEIYAFTNTTSWIPYEDIQADIFDHVLAIVPEFGLRVLQVPSGSDIRYLSKPC
ncbi:MAG TPA: mechanosensitive ion channel protein MscS [Kosmotogaceae bacterium]|nr:MAG: Small-conductance mechanosensitive channel [Thermotogales bacterium 46_20]HAA85591.1 mechanosensitive ion channel protein MscS [Kosmotogaceae bacterium]